MLKLKSLMLVAILMLATACSCSDTVRPIPPAVDEVTGDYISPIFGIRFKVPDWVPFSHTTKMLHEIDWMMARYVDLLGIEGDIEKLSYDLRIRIELMDTKDGYYSIDTPIGTLNVYGHYIPHTGVAHVAANWRGMLDILPHELLHHFQYRLTGNGDSAHENFKEDNPFGTAFMTVWREYHSRNPTQMPGLVVKKSP